MPDTKRPTKAQRRQAKAEELRRQREHEEARRRRLTAMSIGTAVVVGIAVLVGVGLATHKKAKSGTARSLAPASVVHAATTVPTTTLDQIGPGSGVINDPTAIKASPLTKDGKPELLYVGAEYCPYCAAERWAMVVALSRFGTFKNLSITSSSPSDQYPNTPTFSFYGSTYTSQYLSFVGKEIQSNQVSGLTYARLEKLTSDEQSIFTKNTTGYPFLDFGGKYVIKSPQYSPQLIKGMTHEQVAAQLADPTSNVAKGIDGAANVMSAAICKTTNGQPAAICSSPAIQELAGRVGA
jgi:thiol-disulfide isomerase/thioredoxin